MSKPLRLSTSYFANIKSLPPNCIPLSIALYKPTNVKVIQSIAMTPSERIWENWKAGKLTKEEFRQEFLLQLEKEDWELVLGNLAELAQGREIVLLAYELPNKFSHRQVVADFLNKKGLDVQEC